ncbi:hypothetical protein JT26_07405 [Porphyromonas sp. COT-108 OH1349]|nr:hypothetical protein JT26_07405 [Porphyromonas sp. COT-108 OH1349]
MGSQKCLARYEKYSTLTKERDTEDLLLKSLFSSFLKNGNVSVETAEKLPIDWYWDTLYY